MVTIFIRTVIIYIILVCSMRLMGKRQIGELEISDLVTTFLISELASLPITDSNTPLSHAIIPIVTLVTFEVVSSYLLVYFPTLKNIVSARPSVLINKGKPDRRAMLSARISVDELISELRQKDITDISEVQYAILEQNGKITVVQKAPYKTVTAEQLGIDTQEHGISHVAVCEGKINKNCLERLSISEDELLKRIARTGNSIEDIYMMLIDDAGKTQIVKKEN